MSDGTTAFNTHQEWHALTVRLRDDTKRQIARLEKDASRFAAVVQHETWQAIGNARIRRMPWTAPSHANHPPHAGDTGGVGARVGRRRRQLTTMTARRLRLLKQLARIAQQITEAENLTGEAQT